MYRSDINKIGRYLPICFVRRALRGSHKASGWNNCPEKCLALRALRDVRCPQSVVGSAMNEVRRVAG